MLAALRQLCRTSSAASDTLQRVCRGFSAALHDPDCFLSHEGPSKHRILSIGSDGLAACGMHGGTHASYATLGHAAVPGVNQNSNFPTPLTVHSPAAHSRDSRRSYATDSGTNAGDASEQQNMEAELSAEDAAEQEASAEELDKMLDQVTRQADALALTGQPLQAMQLLAEVAEQLEGDLGMEHYHVLRLHDQLAILNHEQGNFAVARDIADRIMTALGQQPDTQPMVHMFRLRRGAAHFALGGVREAVGDFAVATEFLSDAFSPDFEALGEARFYLGLARLLEAKDVDDVERIETRVREALKHMQRDKTQRGAALREVAMREHDCVIDAAIADGDWPRAEALYQQQAGLLRGAGMKGKLLYLLYTFSTLLYIRNDAEAAEAAAQESLSLAKQLFSGRDDEVNLRRLRCDAGPELVFMLGLHAERLGTILLERGRMMEAEPLLMEVAEQFKENLGQDNPVRAEASFALALLRILQLLPFQVAERKQLLGEMASSREGMAAGFGADHPLVHKVDAILESMERT